MGKIMRNDVEYGGGSGGGGDVSQLEQRVERLEDSVDDLDRYKVTQLTFNTGIDIGDWDSVIDPDEPVIYERYTNYHDAVAKLSQQIDIMGARTDDLKTSFNDKVKVMTFTKNVSNADNLSISMAEFGFNPNIYKVVVSTALTLQVAVLYTLFYPTTNGVYIKLSDNFNGSLTVNVALIK